MIIKVDAQMINLLKITLISDDQINTEIILTPGELYTVEYIKLSELCKVTGKLTDIKYTRNACSPVSNDTVISSSSPIVDGQFSNVTYIISIDASDSYEAHVVNIETSSIRSLVKYVESIVETVL